MVRREIITSHVETLLEGMLNVERVVSDAPGQWSIRNGSALYTVRVDDDPHHPHVQVSSVAVEGVRPTKALYERINEYNARASHSRWFIDGDRIIVSSELVGETLDPEELVCACEEIAVAADKGGQALSETFGGRIRFSQDGHPEAEESGDNDRPGMYL